MYRSQPADALSVKMSSLLRSHRVAAQETFARTAAAPKCGPIYVPEAPRSLVGKSLLPSPCALHVPTLPGTGFYPVGTKSNRDGIGARLKIVSASGLTQSFSVNNPVGYLSANDKRVVAGLGSDATAKLIEIRWPSGMVQKFENLKARHYLTAVEPAE